MSISTYTELKTAIKTWLLKGSEMDADVDTLIDLAEAKFNRRLRVSAMASTTSVSTTASTSTLTLPTDLKQIITLEHSSTPKSLDFTTQQNILETYSGSGVTGRPVKYGLYPSGKIIFGPTPDTTYTLTLSYYAAITALSDSNTSNWLLVAAPDCYLYNCLAAAHGYLADEPRMATWKAQADELIEEIILQDRKDRETYEVMQPFSLTGNP